MTISFEVIGKPQGKAATRSFYNRKAERLMHYPDKRDLSYRGQIQDAWLRVQPEGWKPVTGPIFLYLQAFFEVPKSWSKKKRVTALWYSGKPDSGNILKAFEDALTGYAWQDDKQIALARVSKYYCGNGPSRVHVSVRLLPTQADEKEKGPENSGAL